WLSAKRAATFKAPVVLYPVCIAVVWIPSVLLGLFGNIDFPGLDGAASNSVLVRMIALYVPELLAGLLGAGVFAAIMSSLDSQSLSLGTMFTQDVVRHYRWGGDLDGARQVRLGRLFVVGIVATVFLLSLVAERSIFALSVWSFTGFASLLPVVVAALYWRRSTAAGAGAAILTVIALWTWFFLRGIGDADYSVGGTGVMPVAVVFAGSTLAMIVGSLLSRPPAPERVARFIP
ncbi:MAG: sodium:solute symporter family protein, partial [Holophagales bacterium]|nr:sodium:solute symporter family protein [Holophagales bacterium]